MTKSIHVGSELHTQVNTTKALEGLGVALIPYQQAHRRLCAPLDKDDGLSSLNLYGEFITEYYACGDHNRHLARHGGLVN